MSNHTETGAAGLVKVLQEKLKSAEDEIDRLAKELQKKERELDDAERLDAMLQIAKLSGLTVDLVYDLMQDLSIHGLRSVMGRASSMPSDKKSSDSLH